MPQNEVSRPKREIKMPRKKPLKTHEATKMHFFYFFLFEN